MYKAILYRQVAKYYDKFDAKGQRRVNKAIEEIVKKPFEGPLCRGYWAKRGYI